MNKRECGKNKKSQIYDITLKKKYYKYKMNKKRRGKKEKSQIYITLKK